MTAGPQAPPTSGVRLAVWSGPRNISTALMRSWENRPDSVVVDEPFYAAYLAATGLDHPGRDEVIAAGEVDPTVVVAGLFAPVDDGVRVEYQKQMAHHLLPSFDGPWVERLVNVLLIREPHEVVASYLRSRATVTADDIGLPQQARLFDRLAAGREPPVVIDSADFLRAPERYLRALCELVGLGFDDRMLSWSAGPRASDGVWAPYWYASVWASTGFEPYEPRDVTLDGAAAVVADGCGPAYDRLHAVRLCL
jgi:hypothetical protein